MARDMERKRETDRQSYERNRPRKLVRERTRSAGKRHARRLFVLEYLQEHPCVDCGESDPVVLDFDHVGEKRFGLCEALHDLKPMQLIAEEIAQCEIRCANCHRRKTHKARGFTARCQSSLSAVADDSPTAKPGRPKPMRPKVTNG